MEDGGGARSIDDASVDKLLRRPTQGKLEERQRKRIFVSVAVVAALLVAFVVVSHLVPGVTTRAAVAHSVGNSLGSASRTKCVGPLSAMKCGVQDGSGTRGNYLVSASDSCWHATQASVEGLEMPAQARGCVRLWDNIF
jgi:hypothetical protein